MKRYLIRSGIAPNEIKAPEEMILNNLIGGNIGNLIYAYSIYRNLTTENVEIDIEMQLEYHSGFENRMLLYWARMYLGQLKSGEAYEKLNKTIQIF